MRESRTYGSGRGARGNSRPYREMSGDYASQAPVRPTLQFSADKEILNAGIAYRYLAFFRFELWENDICGIEHSAGNGCLRLSH